MSQTTRTRTKQPEIRRDQLLEAAERLFAEKGHIETTVLDIAEAAGVAKGTFYLYFPSKEHCVMALKERLAEGLVERFVSAFGEIFEKSDSDLFSVDLEAVARRLMDESFAYALDHADAFTTLMHRGDTIEIDAASQAAEETITKLIADVLTRLNELGLAQVTHPPETARILFLGVHWALDQALSREGKRDLTDLKEASIELCTRALGGPATTT